MKNIATTLIVTWLALASSAAFAQQKMDDMKGMDMARKPAAAASASTVHMATGIVKKVDPKSGLVTLAHDPVKSMNWPAMTMGFQVQDKMLFDKLSVGKKVDFEYVQGKATSSRQSGGMSASAVSIGVLAVKTLICRPGELFVNPRGCPA